MFISPISFSFVQNRQQKTAKYNSYSNLNSLQSDTISFTGAQKYTRSVHNVTKHAAKRYLPGKGGSNPMQTALDTVKDVVVKPTESVVGKVEDPAETTNPLETIKVLLSPYMYEREGQLMIAFPTNKDELVAMIGRGYHGPAEKAKTFEQSAQILNGESAVGYTGYKPSPANTVEDLVEDIGILGLRKAILPYIKIANEGSSSIGMAEWRASLDEVRKQKYNKFITNGDIIDYFNKLSDTNIPENIENAFFKRMQTENINPKGDLSTNEIIGIITRYGDLIDNNPYIAKESSSNGVVKSNKQNKKYVDPIDEIERKLEKERRKAEAKAKAAAAKAAREEAKAARKQEKAKTEAEGIKPEKTSKQKPVTQMSKKEAETAILTRYIKYLLEDINIYRIKKQQDCGQAKAEELIKEEFAPAFAKYPQLRKFFMNTVRGKSENRFNFKAKLIKVLPAALDERLVEMADGVVEMNTYRTNIATLEEQLAKKGTKNKAKLRVELKENQDKLDETKEIWSDYLEAVVRDENINRETCIVRGLVDEYDYFTATNKELNALKKWETARQENGGVISEDTWSEITKFYGEYIDPLYAEKEPVVHVTKFAFNR